MQNIIHNKILIMTLILCIGIPTAFIQARNETPGTGGGNPSSGNQAGTPSETGSDNTGGTQGSTSGGTQTGGNTSSGNDSGIPGGGTDSGGGGEGEEPTVGNNQSFPVIAADGFSISELTEPSFETPYDGENTGLSAEELAALGDDIWYAQKTEGNQWQADYTVYPADTVVDVYGVDWGDNIEAVSPVIGRPFRLELTMYHAPESPMDAYTMALLAYPSSLNEVQGTNKEIYASPYATVVSSKPQLTIQSVGDYSTTSLTWGTDGWKSGNVTLPITEMSFGSELNVGGKYIFGGSKGGWRPVEPGLYRITFSLPDSNISLADALVGNYADWVTATTEPVEGEEDDEEMAAATPVIDTQHNLTYVDVTVVSKREGRKPENPGEEEATQEVPEAASVIDTRNISTLSTETTETCEPYLTDYLGINLDNDPAQVLLLQDFLNTTLDTSIPLTGYFGEITLDAVKLFQTTYATDILQPWRDAGHTDVSITEGTGYVYITTLETINEIACTGV